MELRSPFSPRERLRGQYAHFRPTFASSRRSSLSATAAVPAASQLSTEEPSSPQPTAARVETAVQTEPEPEPVLQPQSEPRLQSDAQNEAEAEEERQRIDQQLSDLLTPLVVSRQRLMRAEPLIAASVEETALRIGSPLANGSLPITPVKSAGKQEPVATPSPLGPAVPDSVVNLTDVMARLRKCETNMTEKLQRQKERDEEQRQKNRAALEQLNRRREEKTKQLIQESAALQQLATDYETHLKQFDKALAALQPSGNNAQVQKYRDNLSQRLQVLRSFAEGHRKDYKTKSQQAQEWLTKLQQDVNKFEAEIKQREEEARRIKEEKERQERQQEQERKEQQAQQEHEAAEAARKAQEQAAAQQQAQEKARQAASPARQAGGATAADGGDKDARATYEKHIKFLAERAEIFARFDAMQPLEPYAKAITHLFNVTSSTKDVIATRAADVAFLLKLAADPRLVEKDLASVSMRAVRKAADAVMTMWNQPQFQADQQQFLSYAFHLYARQLVVFCGNSNWADRDIPSDAVFAFAHLTMLVQRQLLQAKLKPKAFSNFIIAHFSSECCFLAGYFPRVSDAASEEAFVNMVGMRPGDSREAYYRRVENLTRGYAAFVEARVPDNKPAKGVKEVWELMANILNASPHPGTGPVMLAALLRLCGFHMQNVYGVPFQLMVKCIDEQYIPKLRPLSKDSKDDAAELNDLAHLVNYARTPQGTYAFKAPATATLPERQETDA